MKIAYIYDLIFPYTKGGAEKRFWELAKRLSLKGHEVHIFGMKFWQGNSYLVKDGVHIHGISKPSEFYLRGGLRNIMQVLRFSFNILPYLRKKKIDIIDCNVFPFFPFFSVKLISLFKRIPLVITWQEVWGVYWYRYLGYIKGFIARLIERMVIRSSSNIIVYASKVKEDLVSHGFNKQNIVLIPNGIDLKMIDDVPRSCERTDLIFVGRLIKDKNVDILIKSVFLVKNELSNIKCLIIGKGPEKENIISLIDKLSLKDNVVFKDSLADEEVISYMKASRIFIFPSTREGFGIVALEALACGLPVITVEHPMNAATELIKDGQNGFICKLDENDIAGKIIGLLENETIRSNMSEVARHSVKDYDWDRIVKKNEEFYNYVIKSWY